MGVEMERERERIERLSKQLKDKGMFCGIENKSKLPYESKK